MSKKQRSKHGSGRSFQEYESLVNIIKTLPSGSTTPQTYILRTIDQNLYENEDEDDDVNAPRRKSKSRRLQLYIKENWPNFLIAFFITVMSVLFLTIYPKVIRTEAISEISSKRIDCVENSVKDMEVRFQNEQAVQNEKITNNSADIKSLSNSFLMHIEKK